MVLPPSSRLATTIPLAWWFYFSICLRFLVRAGDEARFIMELPPSSRRQARVHRTLAFRWFEPLPSKKKRPAIRLVFLFGAGDEARTRYLHLGKVALYRMSYTRMGSLGWFVLYQDFFICQADFKKYFVLF